MPDFTVYVEDGKDIYQAHSENKDTVLEFLSWWLKAVGGDAEVNIRFIQRGSAQLSLDDMNAGSYSVMTP
jgi:hypothetical protein